MTTPTTQQLRPAPLMQPCIVPAHVNPDVNDRLAEGMLQLWWDAVIPPPYPMLRPDKGSAMVPIQKRWES